jgi:hypothetical protein
MPTQPQPLVTKAAVSSEGLNLLEGWGWGKAI